MPRTGYGPVSLRRVNRRKGSRSATSGRSSATPEVNDEPEEPRISSRLFLILFVAEVHDLLREVGPLTVEDILVRLPPGWVERTKDYKTIQPGRLRYKLRVRIKWKRPFQEQPDRKFAATGPWPGSRSHNSEEAA